MFILKFPDEGQQKCHVWIVIFDNGKTNSSGKKQYLGYMRNKDLMACTQGALAQYMYNRYHVQEQAFNGLRYMAWLNLRYVSCRRFLAVFSTFTCVKCASIKR
jgi:hypothetical protein